jgi:hypothetical protein
VTTPAPLDWLMARLSQLIGTATDALEAEFPDGVAAWEQEVARQLARYHAAAMLAGAGVTALTGPMTTAVTRDLAVQLAFLRKFGIAIQSGAQWERGRADVRRVNQGALLAGQGQDAAAAGDARRWHIAVLNPLPLRLGYSAARGR